MPSVSRKQQALMGAALERKREGKARKSDPKMSESAMEDFASTPRKGLPEKAKKGKAK